MTLLGVCIFNFSFFFPEKHPPHPSTIGDGANHLPTPHPTPPHPRRLFLRCRELSVEHLGVQGPLQNQGKKKAGVCVSRQDCLAIIIDLPQNMQAYEGLSKFSLKWEMSEGGGGLAERNKEETLKKQATL